MKFSSLFRNVHGQEMCLLPQTTLGIRNSRDKGKCSGTVSDLEGVHGLVCIVFTPYKKILQPVLVFRLCCHL